MYYSAMDVTKEILLRRQSVKEFYEILHPNPHGRE